VAPSREGIRRDAHPLDLRTARKQRPVVGRASEEGVTAGIPNGIGGLRRQLGYLILYGKRTPPESMVMMNGRVQVWVGNDRAEAWRIMDKIVSVLAPGISGTKFVPMAKEVVEELSTDWSRPVQFRVDEDGELTLRTVPDA
jgi:hypothetical protein